MKEIFVAKETGGQGSVWDIEFSPDQQYMYVADGSNEKIWILLRDQLQVVGSFGERGQKAGQWNTAVHDLAVDSKGNIYTGEAENSPPLTKFALNKRWRR